MNKKKLDFKKKFPQNALIFNIFKLMNSDPI